MIAMKKNEAEELRKRHNRARKVKLEPLFHPMNTLSTESLNESDMALFTKSLSFDAYQRAALEIKRIDLS
jgi:hypothetical protein